MTDVPPGLNLHVYRAPIVNESRIMRFAGALQGSGLFEETHIVGTGRVDLLGEEDMGDGRRIVRLPGASGLPGPLGKIIGTLRWSVRVLLRYRTQRVSAVAAHSVWALPLCALLARTSGASLIYNPHELESETPSMQGWRGQVARKVEALFIRRAELVTVVNPSIATWYKEKANPKALVSVRNIPHIHGPDVTAVPDLRGRFGVLSDELLFIHTGHLVGGRHIPEILNAFSTSQIRHHVVFMGDGPLREDVEKAMARSPRVHWVPPVPSDRVVEVVRGADVGLCLIETSALSYAYSSPNKLFEALVAGKPVLVTDLVEAERLMGSAFEKWLVRDPRKELTAVVGAMSLEDVHEWSLDSAPIDLPSGESELSILVSAYRLAVAGP